MSFDLSKWRKEMKSQHGWSDEAIQAQINRHRAEVKDSYFDDLTSKLGSRTDFGEDDVMAVMSEPLGTSEILANAERNLASIQEQAYREENPTWAEGPGPNDWVHGLPDDPVAYSKEHEDEAGPGPEDNMVDYDQLHKILGQPKDVDISKLGNEDVAKGMFARAKDLMKINASGEKPAAEATLAETTGSVAKGVTSGIFWGELASLGAQQAIKGIQSPPASISEWQPGHGGSSSQDQSALQSIVSALTRMSGINSRY